MIVFELTIAFEDVLFDIGAKPETVVNLLDLVFHRDLLWSELLLFPQSIEKGFDLGRG